MLGAAGIASECRFARQRDMTVAVAALLWEIVDTALDLGDEAAMVLAGGSTPAPVYRILSEMPLAWDKLLLCPSDERWVPVDDPASNEGMLRRELLGAAADPPRLISMARRSDSIGDDARASERELEAVKHGWDVVVLGMGEDGHTASLFPGARGLDEALSGDRRCVPVWPAGGGLPRLSLTLPELLDARRIVLLLSGRRKWQVYREAVGSGDPAALPVRNILHQDRVPVDVYWSSGE